MSSTKKSAVLIEDYAANTDDLSHNVPQTVIEGILATAYVFILLIIITSKRKVFRTAFFVMFVATVFLDKRLHGMCATLLHIDVFCRSSS
ncbi:hypothetical protein V3C99_006895 [Haemonchus contortus]